MSQEFTGSVRSRPLRVAFLVQDGEHAQLALDGIFADCYARWGGRFSLVVPCAAGRISEKYWPWLEGYDPDVVYSYVALSKPDVLEIHERLCPAEYLLHNLGPKPRLDVAGFRPNYRFSPLSSLAGVFRLARYRPAHGDGAALKLVDSWHTECPSRLLTDNLGTYQLSAATGMYPPDASAAAQLLTVVSPEFQADRKYVVPRDLLSVPNELAALKEFATRRATSMSLMSALFASKLEIQNHTFSGSFNLVVGDAFADRLLFWNARLFIPSWLDTDLCCFRVTSDDLNNPEFLAALGDIIRHRNHVNHSSGGQSQLTIRSVSLDTAQLDSVKAQVLSTKMWSAVSTQQITNLDELVPSKPSLEQAREHSHLSWELFQQRPNWSRFNWTSSTARPPSRPPDHLADAPVRQAFTLGHWVTDVALQHAGPGPRMASDNKWSMPRRWRMAGAFTPSLSSSPQHELPLPARRNRDGNLSLFVSETRILESIKVPTVFEAITHALALDGRWAADQESHGLILPANKVAWISRSNEARYLAGVLGLCGGLDGAIHLLLHPFLRSMFSKLGGTPNVPGEALDPTISRLTNRLKNVTSFDVTNETDKHVLADMIVRAAQDVKAPQHFVRYDTLKSDWKKHRKSFWASQQNPHGQDSTVDWDRLEDNSLDSCLIHMRRQKLAFQGHQWSCRTCHHRNWVDFTALSTDLQCEVCKAAVPAPVEFDWLFRANDFLIECLRDHSVLSLVWVLAAFRARARHSLLFVEPTWFGFGPEADNPDAEADLLIVFDGKAVLCEVKSSWRSLRTKDIEGFVELAKRLRPDIALLAVMEDGDDAKLNAARADLAAVGIAFELLTPKQYQFEDDPYLYQGEG